VTKSGREIMEIFEAFDLTGTAWSAAQLTGYDAKTVARYVAVREAGGDPLARAARPRLIDVRRVQKLRTTSARSASSAARSTGWRRAASWCASALASTSSSAMSCSRRCDCRTARRAISGHGARSGWARPTSSPVRIAVSGLRSSCEASATKRRCRDRGPAARRPARACRPPQAAQQAGHGPGVVEGGVGGGMAGQQRGGLLVRARLPQTALAAAVRTKGTGRRHTALAHRLHQR
jgi:hypothetical protein